ncbi:MAG: S1C family serine protease [Acidimicrobiales bacterium]
MVGLVVGHALWQPGPATAVSNIGGSPGFSGAPGVSPSPGSSGPAISSGSSGPSNVSAIASRVDPGLVDINTSLAYRGAQAAGTGMVLTSTGEILTNNHVIEGETSLTVTDVGNGKTYAATVVGYDRTADVAVLQLRGASGLKTVATGNSSQVAVGQKIVGIGNAGGLGGTPSAAGGSVVALHQSIAAGDALDGTTEQLKGLFETNANIQPGDSGGPLVTTSMKVVGMDTAASAGFSYQPSNQSSGIQAYAIPIGQALSIAHAIVAGHASSAVHVGPTGFLGVEVASLPGGAGSGGAGSSSGAFGGRGSGGSGSAPGSSGGGSTPVPGAVVAGVLSGSPAQAAGLARGDVITSFNGRPVASPTALTNMIERFHPGDKVSVGWTDAAGQAHTALAQLAKGPPQ